MSNLLRATGLRFALALGLAFSLWAFVTVSENPESSLIFEEVPVALESTPPGLVVVDSNGAPRTELPKVQVTVTADAQTITSIKQNDVRAFVDLSNLAAGEESVPVNIVPTRSGLGRSNITAYPVRVPIRLEQAITNTVPITIEVAGIVPFSYRQLTPQATSNEQPIQQVQISGPQGRVSQVAYVRASVNIDRLTANYSSPRSLDAMSQDGQIVSGVTVMPDSVDVKVPIVSSVGTKRVPVVPNVVGEPASGFVVSDVAVDPQFVVLTGNSGQLDTVQQVATENVDISGGQNVITRTVNLVAPSDTLLQEDEPKQAVITVRFTPIAQTFRVTVPVAVQASNIPSGLLASFSPAIVEAALTGTSQRLQSIGQTTLAGTIDLNGLAAGSYSLEPRLNLPEGVSLSGTPPRVTVTLRAEPTDVPPTATQAPSATPAPTTEATETIQVQPTTEPAAPSATSAPEEPATPAPTEASAPAQAEQPTPSN